MNEYYKIKLKKNADIYKIENSLKKLNLEFKKVEYFSGYQIYKIKNVDEKLKNIILNIEGVKKISPMRKYYLDFKTREVNSNINLPMGLKKENPVIIGVIDNGIYRNELIKSWLYEDEKKYCSEDINPTHGTFVAGVILQQLHNTTIKIYDAAIVPDFNTVHLEEDELLFRLKKVIEEHRDIKVWNLAISIRYSTEKDCISDFGVMLDYLQEKYDILIIKSVGNGEFKKTQIEKRLFLVGADTARALVVGSCNNQNQVSSFSLCGSGHKILVKPDIATYGGDIYLNEEGKVKVEGVISFSNKGKTVSSFGTSFAAARMSGYAGEILEINKNATPLFIKAFLIYLAKNPQKYLLGYGYIDKNIDIKKEYKRIVSIEREVLEEVELEFEFKNYKFSFSLACDIEIDYNDEEYILADVDVKLFCEGKEIKNTHTENKELNSLKKYAYEFEKKDGRVKLICYKRWKKSKIQSLKKMKFCIVTKNEN